MSVEPANILLIDSDERNRRTLEVSLRKAGFDVISWQRIPETLSERDKADLSDIGVAIVANTRRTPCSSDMAALTQNEKDADIQGACNTIRSQDRLHDIPIILLTDEDSIEARIQAVKTGIDVYLIKPIFIKEVVAHIQMLVARSRRAHFSAQGEWNHAPLTGSLADTTLADLVQMMELDRRSGTITLYSQHHGRGDDLGTVYLRDGKVIDSAIGKTQGRAALYRLFTWNIGRFELVAGQVRRRDRLETTNHALLVEGMRRISEWESLSALIPPLTTVLEIDYIELGKQLRDLSDELNPTIRLFDGHRSLREVIEDSTIDDLFVLRSIVYLYEKALLIAVDPTRSAGTETRRFAPLEARLPDLQPAEHAAPQPAIPVDRSGSPNLNSSRATRISSHASDTGPSEPRRGITTQHAAALANHVAHQGSSSVAGYRVQTAKTAPPDQPARITGLSAIATSRFPPTDPEVARRKIAPRHADHSVTKPYRPMPDTAPFPDPIGAQVDPQAAAHDSIDATSVGETTEQDYAPTPAGDKPSDATNHRDASAEYFTAPEEAHFAAEMFAAEAYAKASRNEADDDDLRAISSAGRQVRMRYWMGAALLGVGAFALFALWPDSSPRRSAKVATGGPKPHVRGAAFSAKAPVKHAKIQAATAKGPAGVPQQPDVTSRQPESDPARLPAISARYARLVDEGLSAHRARRNQIARKILSAALKENPKGWEALERLALIALERDAPRRAVELSHRALAINKNAPRAHLVLGSVAHDNGETDTARRAYSEFLRVCPKCPDAADVRAVLDSFE